MPIATSPHQTTDFVLEIDRALPEAERPTFELRFVTGAESRRIRKLATEAANLKQEEQATAKFLEAMGLFVVGWRNLKHPRTGEPISFDLAKLEEVLSNSELAELFWRGQSHLALTEDDLKKSVSPSASASASTASDAQSRDIAGTSQVPVASR
jgi:hypothetical protein